jgi:hypothetical protein
VNCYPFIEVEKACRRNVKRACELLKVSRAAFYQHVTGKVSQRRRQDAELTGQIQAVHQASKGRYGAPRIHAELARRGRRDGRKRVARLMRSPGICGKTPKRWRKTTIADPSAAARADRIRRGAGGRGPDPDKSDPKDAAIIARLAAGLHCYEPERAHSVWQRIRSRRARARAGAGVGRGWHLAGPWFRARELCCCLPRPVMRCAGTTPSRAGS